MVAWTEWQQMSESRKYLTVGQVCSLGARGEWEEKSHVTGGAAVAGNRGCIT